MPPLTALIRRRQAARSMALLVTLLSLATGDRAAAEGAQEPSGGEGGKAVIRISLPEEVDGASSPLPPPSDEDLATLLPPEATMVVLDTGGRGLIRLRPEQADRPLPPCSTFKIPNTLIALGAGAITVDDHAMKRDAERDPRRELWSDAWDADQDLPSALRRSTVWYYQELARRVGRDEMQRQVDRLGYGNRDLSGPIDRFWLGAPLLISATGQVEFLHRLHAGEPAFPPAHLALLRQGLLQERGEEHALYAKTGACPVGGSDRWVGWWVGWVERPRGPAFFALALTGADYREIAPRRVPLARSVLTRLGILPPAD